MGELFRPRITEYSLTFSNDSAHLAEMLDIKIKKEVIDTSYEEAQQEAQQEARPPVNKPFCCTVCPKRFISQNALNGHKAVHSRTAAKQSEDLQGYVD